MHIINMHFLHSNEKKISVNGYYCISILTLSCIVKILIFLVIQSLTQYCILINFYRHEYVNKVYTYKKKKKKNTL